MDAWLYYSDEKLHALTIVSDGANLPSDLGPWTRIRCITLRHDTDDERNAINLITEHGFCCFE